MGIFYGQSFIAIHTNTCGERRTTSIFLRADQLVKNPSRRKNKKQYSKGELNILVGSVFHPLRGRSSVFMVAGTVLHGLIEQNPKLIVRRFARYALPKIIEGVLKSLWAVRASLLVVTLMPCGFARANSRCSNLESSIKGCFDLSCPLLAVDKDVSPPSTSCCDVLRGLLSALVMIMSLFVRSFCHCYLWQLCLW